MTGIFSLNQALWIQPEIELDSVERIVRRYNLPEIIARLLCLRGVKEDRIAEFLSPSLKDHFPDPFSLAGMRECAGYLADAITAQKSIALFGDFDVDGATSSAVLARFLRALGIEAPIYIPGRLTEGYGPNEEALRHLKEQGAEIVILLDCGTTAFDTVQAGADMGLEIVIVDHHEAEDQLPVATHVINPKRQDDASGLDMLAACGVTFMLCVAVNNVLREKGYYTQNKVSEPDLRLLLDLVALGTVCDMVPLTGPNRLFVRSGFKYMERTQNPGLKALMEVAGLDGPPDTYHAGFVLGPRINAGSRVHKSDLGARMLATENAEESRNIAFTLNDCNDKRKAIQAQMEREALHKVEALGLENEPVIIVDDENWHQGLSGLVAGRLKEKFQKPACVIAYAENGEGRGSGRSVPGVHIARAFIDARQAGLLEKGGGHAMAGGFTVLRDKLSQFRVFMHDHIERQMQNRDPNVEVVVDGILTVRGASLDLVKMLQDQIGPFGQGHPEPLFWLQNVRLHSVDIVGESHIKMQVSDWEGGPRLKAVAFRSVGTKMGGAFLKNGREPFHLLGRLKINSWMGRESVEMHVKDAAFASSVPAATDPEAAQDRGLHRA